jgi:hypothetical protein
MACNQPVPEFFIPTFKEFDDIKVKIGDERKKLAK